MKTAAEVSDQVAAAAANKFPTVKNRDVPLDFHKRVYAADGSSSKRSKVKVEEETSLTKDITFVALMPGAYTPTCNKHFKELMKHAKTLAAYGIKVAAITGDNCDVADKWARDTLQETKWVKRAGLQKSPTLVQDNVLMVADHRNLEIMRACGIESINIDGLDDVAPRGLLVLKGGKIIGKVVEPKANAGICANVSVSVAVGILIKHLQQEAMAKSSTPAFASSQVSQEHGLQALANAVRPIANNPVIRGIITRLQDNDQSLTEILLEDLAIDQHDVDLLEEAMNVSKSPVAKLYVSGCTGFEIMPISSNPTLQVVGISCKDVSKIEHGELPGLKSFGCRISEAAIPSLDIVNVFASAPNLRSDCSLMFVDANGDKVTDNSANAFSSAINGICEYRGAGVTNTAARFDRV